MSLGKRALDILVSALLLALLSPVILVVALAVLLRDGRPVFFASERMNGPESAFTLWKFRTMRNDPNDAGVTGADKTDRITGTGRWLRKRRLDELPQLWNVLRGDISLVGPRPPLRLYVEEAPELYARVLRNRPGITGLATLVYVRHEEAVLSGCRSPQETHDAYLRRCVPAKAHIDLIYGQNRSLCFDLVLLWRTLRTVTRSDKRGRRRYARARRKAAQHGLS